MSTIVMESQVVHIPDWVHDLSSFRRWADSDVFPEKGQIHHLNGEVWVDMSKEQVLELNIPTGRPITYEIDASGRVLSNNRQPASVS